MELSWNEDDLEDRFTFVVVMAVRVLERGVSTCALCNRKSPNPVKKKCSVLGHSTITLVSQFDIVTETGIECSEKDMRIVGIGALRAFLDGRSHQPFSCWNLHESLEATELKCLTAQPEELDSEDGF